MNYKKIILVLLSICVVGVIVALILQKGGVAEFLFPFSIITFVLSFTLRFLPELVFHAWKKFALWFVPISIVLTALSPEQRESGIFGPLFFSPDQESTVLMMAFLFSFISLILIIRKIIKLHRDNLHKDVAKKILCDCY